MSPWDHVFRWDLDKTYLDTRFDDLGELVKTFLQPAEEKRAVPGADVLLRELLRPPGKRHGVFFISGSPRQMRKVLLEKLRLDGIDPDELVLKPNLSNLLRGRFRALREQVGYKLPALLEARARCDPATRETLFGDDAESDALVYSLYADLVEGRLSAEGAERVLEAARAYPDAVRAVRRHLEGLVPRPGVVERIYIRLDRQSAPGLFAGFGPRLVPIANYFQAALLLGLDGHLLPTAVLAVLQDLVSAHGFDLFRLASSLQDLARRGHLAPEAALAALEGLVREAPGESRELVAGLLDRARDLLASVSPPPPAPEAGVDYVAWVTERAKEKKEEKPGRRRRRPLSEPPHLAGGEE